jgi:hypothetical protein
MVVFSSKLVPLPNLINPDSILIDNDQIYITDMEKIYIYSSKDFTLKKKFGKKGEGPGEFKVNPAAVAKLQVYVQPGCIIVNNLSRVSFFTKNGSFIKEINVITGLNFIPIGNKFVGYSGTKRIKNILYLTINLYDSNLNKIKEIYSREYYVQRHKDFNLIKLGFGNIGRAYHLCCGDKIFVEGEKDIIHVFDKEGKKEYDINLDFEKLKISQDHKNVFLKDIKVLFGPTMKRLIKEKGKFPRYFPARFFKIANEKIYIPSYKKRDGKTEFVVYNIKGKLLKKIFLPLKDRTLVLPYPYAISNNKIYQVFDDAETEEWELQITGILE